MTKALVIYDSAYGNTEQVARAIGDALGPPEAVTLLHVRDARPDGLAGAALLVVGCPTQRFRPSAPVAHLLRAIPAGSLRGVHVAAFDTRLAASDFPSPIVRFMINTGGYAAKTIADRLRKSGGSLIAPPEGFFVAGTEGPLKPGELARARAWAVQLAAAVEAASSGAGG